jgi:hypothetical protein
MTGDDASVAARVRAVPWAEDLFRHLADLRTGTFEGAGPRADRLRLFRAGADLADPVIRRVLAEADEVFLLGTGQVTFGFGEYGEDGGGVRARWELSWPLQREAAGRDGTPVTPIQVTAFYRQTSTNPHLRGSSAGDWPFQVLTPADAQRQEPIVRAIVEAELHQKVFDAGTWRVIPAAAAAD